MQPIIDTLYNSSGRFIIVGDLHGCYREASALLEAVNVTDRDTVIFVGDMVDRGEDSGKSLDLAMKHKAIRGNHEQYHIDGGQTSAPDYFWRARSQMNNSHFSYMRSLPHMIRLPQYDSVVVHAGLFPGKLLENQSAKHCLSMQAINPLIDEKSYWMCHKPDSYQFWSKLWKGPERAIFGHSVLNKPLYTQHAVGIDGGCCFGHNLFAFILPDEIFVSIPSFNPSAEEWTGHQIHEDVRTY